MFRRDATKLLVFDGFFTPRKDGFFGVFWDPDKNLKVSQCAYPVDSFSVCRYKEVGTESDEDKDRCSDIIFCAFQDIAGATPQRVLDLKPFMCNDEKKEESIAEKKPSCIQQMLEVKKKKAEYQDFMHRFKNENRTKDFSYTEVVIDRDQSYVETDDSPRNATGWLWVHKGPELKRHKALQGDTRIKELLCGLYHWDAGLEHPRYLLQMISSTDYAGDTKADDIFDVIDLGQLCSAESEHSRASTSSHFST